MPCETARPFIDPNQTVQDLRHAAEYIMEHTWLQGYNFDGKGGCCAFGAILIVTHEEDPPSRRERSSNACRAFYRVVGQDITNYNDLPGRTFSEVIRTLQAVADTIEKDPRLA